MNGSLFMPVSPCELWQCLFNCNAGGWDGRRKERRWIFPSYRHSDGALFNINVVTVVDGIRRHEPMPLSAHCVVYCSVAIIYGAQ